MVIDWFYTVHAVKNWWENQEGVAAIEAAILMPPMVLLMAGAYDMGTGIILSGRTITASQVVADLICREKTADLADVNDAIVAAQLVYQPFLLNGFGIDVASIQFDSAKHPQVLWRQTQNMSPNTAAVASVDGIGASGEGMVIVTVQYTYHPIFMGYFTSDINMKEVSFARGRRSPTVEWGG